MPTSDQATPTISTSEMKSLVTIETAERLIVLAVNLLDGLNVEQAGEGFDMAAFAEARRFLVATTDETTTRTCTAVKSLPLSDAIAAEVRPRVSRIVAAK